MCTKGDKRVTANTEGMSRLLLFGQSAAPLTKLLFALVQITARMDRMAQREKHFSSPHREAMEHHLIFPDGLSSSSRLSCSCFLFDPPIHPVQQWQFSHYWLRWAPFAEVSSSSLPLLALISVKDPSPATRWPVKGTVTEWPRRQ